MYKTWSDKHNCAPPSLIKKSEKYRKIMKHIFQNLRKHIEHLKIWARLCAWSWAASCKDCRAMAASSSAETASVHLPVHPSQAEEQRNCLQCTRYWPKIESLIQGEPREYALICPKPPSIVLSSLLFGLHGVPVWAVLRENCNSCVAQCVPRASYNVIQHDTTWCNVMRHETTWYTIQDAHGKTADIPWYPSPRGQWWQEST